MTVGNNWMALAQFVLGLAQMTGAVMSLGLLLEAGASQAALVAVCVTCALTTTSVLLFGRRR